MTVLDSFAVIALLRGEPAAQEVLQLLDDEENEARLTALGLAEVVDHLVRVVGATDEDAALDIAQLDLGDATAVDSERALRAGLLRARHYHRVDRAVSLADCVAAEEARVASAGLATADPHLLDLCRDEGIGVVPLLDSTGHRWSP